MAKIGARKRAAAVGKPKRTKKTPAFQIHKTKTESTHTSKPSSASQETAPLNPPLERAGGAEVISRPTAAAAETTEARVLPTSADATSGTTSTGSAEAPSGVSAAETEKILELLAFQLADEEYAVDILMIKEIIRPIEITSVPRTRPVIKGIISLRGTIIPISDLRIRLGLAESPPGRRTRILVVALEKGPMGLIADGVTEVVKIKLSEVEPPPATGGGQLSGHLKGVTRINGRLLILLDLEKAVGMD